MCVFAVILWGPLWLHGKERFSEFHQHSPKIVLNQIRLLPKMIMVSSSAEIRFRGKKQASTNLSN